jgi:hypothetical protein
MTSTLGRRLAFLLGVVYLAFGVAELVTLDEGLEHLFWAISLLCGSALLFGGLLMAGRSGEICRAMVAVGAVAGIVATLWTIVVPVVALGVTALALRDPRSVAP